MLYRSSRLPLAGFSKCHQCSRKQCMTPPIRKFHATRIYRQDEAGIPNYYEVLGIERNATPGEIKKKFYSLSKTHHPDHNPHDPGATERFTKISEAYATLGSAEKRARYDRDTARAAPTGPSHRGSYHSSSSHSGPAGGRPASGLSRRRTQFKGPPPSFFRNGGWGTQGAKRSENENFSHSGEGSSTESSYASDAPGTGPSGFAQGLDNDVPHFDRAGHFRTQEEVQRARHRKRSGVQSAIDDFENSAKSSLVSFVVISGVLGVILTVSGFFAGTATAATTVTPASMKKKEKT